MDLFTNYETHRYRFATSDGPFFEQEVLGWSAGGCAVVWSDLLPRIVAFHGKELCSGKTVLCALCSDKTVLCALCSDKTLLCARCSDETVLCVLCSVLWQDCAMCSVL